MEYLKKRLKFILIIIFSIIIIGFVQYEMRFDNNIDLKKVGFLMNLLQVACGGYGIYGLIQFFRVK